MHENDSNNNENSKNHKDNSKKIDISKLKITRSRITKDNLVNAIAKDQKLTPRMFLKESGLQAFKTRINELEEFIFSFGIENRKDKGTVLDGLFQVFLNEFSLRIKPFEKELFLAILISLKKN